MKFDWFLQEMPSLHRHNVIKHLKSQVVVLKKILVFLILVSVVVTCKTDKKDSIVQVNNELIKIVDRHFNTTDQNPYINDSTKVKIANEIADYLVKNKSPDNVLTNLKDSSITHVEKIDSLIYKFSFPLAY